MDRLIAVGKVAWLALIYAAFGLSAIYLVDAVVAVPPAPLGAALAAFCLGVLLCDGLRYVITGRAMFES